MRDYIPTFISSLSAIFFVMVAGRFGYSGEALLLLVVTGIPAALFLRYRKLGTLIRKDDDNL